MPVQYVQFGTFIGLEGDAASISEFNPSVISGLLQTEDYARAIMAGDGSSPQAVEEGVSLRLRRQDLLHRDDPPELRVIVDEAALHRRIGSRSTMRAQLDHLIARSSLPNISVQAIPHDRGTCAAISSSFTILEFTGQITDIVCSEGLFGMIYLERPQDTHRYRSAFLNAQSVAANYQESIELIAKINRDSHQEK